MSRRVDDDLLALYYNKGLSENKFNRGSCLPRVSREQARMLALCAFRVYLDPTIIPTTNQAAGWLGNRLRSLLNVFATT